MIVRRRLVGPPRGFRPISIVLLLLVISAVPRRTWVQVLKNDPIPATEAPRRMKLPDGFSVNLFAGEPDVVQPIAMTLDPKGRLWVVENYSYPEWQGGPRGKDRILIFEDTDGDGVFDRRTVFFDKGTNLTGIELRLRRRLALLDAQLALLPRPDGEDKPDGAPEIKLDGWSTQRAAQRLQRPEVGAGRLALRLQRHHRPRRASGKPGTPADKDGSPSTAASGATIRPREVRGVAHGTTNPWGLDFDEQGEMFITNCVIPHLFHVVPGAHFERMFGEDMSPVFATACMESCADHLHWAGGHWTDSRERQGRTQRGRRRPCPRRLHDLPGRQLARALPQRRLHVQPPRQPNQPRPPRAARARATWPGTSPTS